MYGMMCAIITAGFWDNFACHLELPVSTTHTVVGAVVGMSIAIQGGSAVVWSAPAAAFPYLQGMSVIFLSWIISPIAAGIVAAILFGALRTFVLRAKNSFTRALYVLPFLVGGTFWLIVSFIIQTGNKNHTWKQDQSDARVAWIGAVIGGGFGLLTAFVIMPLIRNRILKDEDIAIQRLSNKMEGGSPVEESGEGDIKLGESKQAAVSVTAGRADEASMWPKPIADGSAACDRKWESFKATAFAKWVGGTSVFRILTYGSNYKIHDDIQNNEVVSGIWETAEVFDYNTEMVFRYLQVFTAMVMSFAHGSNDVANAMGPFSAVWTVWQTSAVPTKTPVPTWILAYGGAGIVLGLALYGYQIMRVFGVKSVKLTNSRGFCLELATAINRHYRLPLRFASFHNSMPHRSSSGDRALRGNQGGQLACVPEDFWRLGFHLGHGRLPISCYCRLGSVQPQQGLQ
eukprot:jgi/Botrbrau1/15756/Bobra.4_1s0120.1